MTFLSILFTIAKLDNFDLTGYMNDWLPWLDNNVSTSVKVCINILCSNNIIITFNGFLYHVQNDIRYLAESCQKPMIYTRHMYYFDTNEVEDENLDIPYINLARHPVKQFVSAFNHAKRLGWLAMRLALWRENIVSCQTIYIQSIRVSVDPRKYLFLGCVYSLFGAEITVIDTYVNIIVYI